MKLYTVADLNRGSGVFDHVMRGSLEFDSNHQKMSREVAVGTLIAAIKAGVSNKTLKHIISVYFDNDTASLLTQVHEMYDGPDTRIHLWETKADGSYRLTAPLAKYSSPQWTEKTHSDHYPF